MNKETAPNLQKTIAPKYLKQFKLAKRSLKMSAQKSKLSMAIFRQIHELEQDVVVKAFVDGAILKPKGALTC